MKVTFKNKYLSYMCYFKPSRRGLVVERWSDNRLHFASVGLHPV